MTPTARRARYAANHRHAVERLLRIYDATSPAERAEGRAWYPEAGAVAARLARPEAGIGILRAAAIIAALSPQVRWRQNVAGAARLIDQCANGQAPRDLPGFPANHAKALKIAEGAEPETWFGGEAPKVRAFYAAITGDLTAVVLDVWAMRAATGVYAPPPPRGQRYRATAAWYRTAAKRVNETPRDFQAIIWNATRGALEYERDVLAQQEGDA